MAMGMHGPVPIPRLRRVCCSPSSSHLDGCTSYRWHSANCALPTETLSRPPSLGFKVSQSTDNDWRSLEESARKDKNERNRRHHRQIGPNDLAANTPFSGLVVVNGRPTKMTDTRPAIREGYDVARLSPEANDLAEGFGNTEACRARFSSPSASLQFRKTSSWDHINGGNKCSAVQQTTSTSNATRINGASGGKQLACKAVVDVLEHQDTDEHFNSMNFVTKHLDGDENVGSTSHDTDSLDRRVSDIQSNQEVLLQPAENVSALSKMAAEDHTQVDSSNRLTEAAELPLSDNSPGQSNVARLACTADDIIIVDNIATATTVLAKLRGEYKDAVHACDTEVADIDVKKESPVGHGRVICFSIYCGPNADFGDRKNCVWVDVLDSNIELLNIFREYFEDSSIKKVWHNFSFDRHVLANHGIRVAGFYADTMQLARLWHSGRKGAEGSYSLESLTSDMKAMNGVYDWDSQTLTKKTSMMELFGTKKLKKDGTEGSMKVLPPVEELQRSETTRERWICYSSGDALCTWRLWESLYGQLSKRKWYFQNDLRGSMYEFYDTYWRPFGELLADMEGHGMLVDIEYLAEIEKIACKERAISISRFRKWVAKYCSCADYINVTSDAQIRQLLFGGFKNVSKCRSFKVPNVDGYIEEGKKAPLKFRSIEVCGIGVKLPCHSLTSGGLPAVGMQSLKSLAGKVSIDYVATEDEEEFIPEDVDAELTSGGIKDCKASKGPKQEDLSAYGQAYSAFKGGEEGKEACKAIAALCEISAIDTLISGFIQPLQGGDSMGPDNRVHCSLNLNTETGRLSARRPNLQNQPALEKDRYKIRQAFIASPGNSLIVADYGQLELRLLAHLADCKSMLEAFKIGGDFHSRTAMNMFANVKAAVEKGEVLLEWEPKPGQDSPPAPLLKDVYAAERRKAKMLNFSIAYGKTARGLSKDWKVTTPEAQETVNLWYKDRPEVRKWQEAQKKSARDNHCVYTLLGRARHFPDVSSTSEFHRGRIDRAAINTPVQGSAADVAMLAMIELWRSVELKELGWKLLLQVHDEMILEGPTKTAAYAKDLVVKAMSHPFEGVLAKSEIKRRSCVL
ncbi:hypothetical protein GOP47_0004740 [Adiantum capillus-veneris]|uniref:DNA-directed DNA polymerase n=1 Tax=Adiantum capillus-veneris TaxID=13818 RepID=A0A9D4V3U4_ADICA|nr:hypothetical protein GOP47_0004740 [Adiantum capillus-veneris]